MSETFDIKSIFENFRVYGDFIAGETYGNGHINDTFMISTMQAARPVRYLLQRINTNVFTEPEKLMANIHRICNELHRRIREEGGADASRAALTTLLTEEGLPYYRDDEDRVWRLYLFIEGAIGYDIIENEEQASQAARAFGEYQKLLTDLPGERLHETIPGFHDTPKRLKKFQNIVEADKLNLAATAAPEIDFLLSLEDEASKLISLNEAGLIPERITHNDTKLNNVLIDVDTHEAICVIDLDTSMPGLAPYDFGDLVRTSTVLAAEDEKDLSKIIIRPEMFKALAKGYLSTAASFLTQAELENLTFGGKLITYEQGIRFLTDYLEGNTYYKVKYNEHNLVRCRTQVALVREIEGRMNEFDDFIFGEYRNIIRKAV